MIEEVTITPLVQWLIDHPGFVGMIIVAVILISVIVWLLLHIGSPVGRAR